ncbi:MAG: dihydropteroate synthase [Actinobacteria bacterium]|nr:dihydropteroate synthase [Actinomycetota bacterium]
MFIIAENINIMSRRLGPALKGREAEPLQDMARRLEAAGADALDINLGPARKDGEELMRFAIDSVSAMTRLPLCLDTTNPDALAAGIAHCDELGLPKPLINSFSMQPDKLERILPLAATSGCDIIGLMMGDAVPADADERIAMAFELVAAANELGIGNDRLYLDPIILPVTLDVGQQGALAVQEALRALPDMFDPPVKTTCGLSNVSNGMPTDLRSGVNCVYMAMLAALGMSSAIVDVLDPQMMRTLRLIRALRNESLFSVSDAELA